MNSVAAPLAAIGFGSLPMLGWLAAAALPWLISLWNRRRREQTPWAAVDLLLTAVRRSSRRLKLRQWLLLALRTLLLALAALAAAEPFWYSGAATGLGQPRTHHVLVIDRSLSMGVETDGATRLDRAKGTARQWIEQAAAGDAFTVVAWADAADNLQGRATFDPTQALSAVASIDLHDTAARAEAAVESATAAVTSVRTEFADVPLARIVFLSDMTATTWQRPGGGDPLATLAERLREQNDGATAEIETIRVDDPWRGNLAVADLALEQSPVVLDQPAVAAAEIANFGDSAATARLDLAVDGEVCESRSVEIEAFGSATVPFEFRFVTPGPHWLEVRLYDAADRLQGDNRRLLSLDVRSAVRAACFYGRPGAADDVARALNPRGDAAGVAVDVLSVARLTSTDLLQYDAVALSDVADPSPREARMLERYVGDGGALMIWLGGSSRPQIYNERFGDLLPASIGDALESGDWHFDPLGYEHPILTPFAGRERTGLLNVQVSRYWPLDELQGNSRVALALTSGDPAIVTGDYGAGRVAVIATDPALRTDGTPWSTWAVSPSFLPLVRELFAYLTVARRGAIRNVLAGEPLHLGRDANGASVRGPDGDMRTISGGTFEDTHRAGVYEVVRSGGEKALMAVNVDPRESDLTTAVPSQRASFASQRAVATTGMYRLQQPLLWLVASLALAELLVARHFGKGAL